MDNSKYLELFLSESSELLSAMNASLVSLEKNTGDKECLNEIFRSVHTLKGIAATMGYETITAVAHEMETFLDQLRQGKVTADKTTMDNLFAWCDTLEKKVEAVRPSIVTPEVKKEIQKISSESAVRPAPQEPHPEKKELQTVRVASEQLDRLMDVVGELVIHKARFAQLNQQLGDRGLEEALMHFDRLTDELQNGMMQVRLVPVDYIFNRFPRMVRDVAGEEKKQVDLLIEGSEIGLDRTILDEINEPLVHLLRNAVHHGIETPEERIKKGKPARGTIRLTASRQRHFIVIEVSDDGRGMDPEKIKKLAVEKGIITSEEAGKLSPEEALFLITSPAFSTSEAVTQTSGRGFGMNAVKTTLSSFGGSLKIHSVSEKSSHFFLNVPLSLAIVQALLVKLGRQTYAIPLSNICETMKINVSMIRKIENSEMIPYRGGILPILRLSDYFGLSVSLNAQKELSLVIVESGPRKVGFVVDAFQGQQEIVIKGLKNSLKNVKGIAGATVLGTGEVAMIVDVTALLLESALTFKGDAGHEK